MIELSKEQWDAAYVQGKADIDFVGDRFKEARSEGMPIDSDFVLMTAVDRYYRTTESELYSSDPAPTFESSYRIVGSSVLVFLEMENLAGREIHESRR